MKEKRTGFFGSRSCEMWIASSSIGVRSLVVVLLVLVCLVGESRGQSTFATTTTSSRPPISITQLNDWNFGILFTGTTPGTVALTTSGAISATGGVTAVSSVASNPASATFRVTGASGATYSIVFPSTIKLARTGGGGAITLDGFKSSGTGILTNGSETFTVAATMHLGALQPSGIYTGTNYITVVYN